MEAGTTTLRNFGNCVRRVAKRLVPQIFQEAATLWQYEPAQGSALRRSVVPKRTQREDCHAHRCGRAYTVKATLAILEHSRRANTPGAFSETRLPSALF